MIGLGEVAIMGGGCYGTFYLGQLGRARRRGAATWSRVLVVDQDPDCQAAARVARLPGAELVVSPWAGFLDRWLDEQARGEADHLVPTPLMPHLFADWLATGVERRWPGHATRRVVARTPVGTPFDMLHPGDGNRYVSHADWICPIHCIEPARCPRIRATRSWEMSDTVAEWNAERPGGPSDLAVFACRHVVYGVGMVRASALLEAADRLDASVRQQGQAEMVVGSVSSCHGALGILRVERR